MKVYDKEIYEKQESIKFTLLVIFVFLVGFFAGYLACSFVPKDAPVNKTVKIENVSENNNKNK